MKIITILHDPTNIFLPLVREIEDGLAPLLKNSIVAHTETTQKEILDWLEARGATNFIGGLFGESRISGIKKALEKDSHENTFFVIDFDKLLHWVLLENEELQKVLQGEVLQSSDFFIFGRNETAMNTYPSSWIATESIAGRFVSEVLGLTVEPLAAVCLMNRRSALVIGEKAEEKGWASCVEWPLIVHNNNLKVEYVDAKGLTWEDPDRFQNEISEAGSLEDWIKERYDGIGEWSKRIMILNDQLSVIKKYCYKQP